MKQFAPILVFFFSIIVPHSSGLALDPSKKITQYVHDSWGLEDGLPQISVRSIIQTSDGYLWLGTLEGLVRFDGVRFEVYDKVKIEHIRDNKFNALYEDREKNLWCGTDGGLIRIKEGKFITYTTLQGLIHDRVLAIHEDRRGRLWVGTEGGLNFIENGQLNTYTPGIDGNPVRVIYEGQESILWIGTDRGLTRLDFSDGTFRLYTTKDGLTGNKVQAIAEDREGNLWIGINGGGLNCFENGTFKPYTAKDGLSNDIVLAIYKDRQGNLWIGTNGGGLNRLKDGRLTSYTSKDGLTDDSVTSIFEDREGNFWIGTHNGGLNRLKNGRFTAYTNKEGLSSNVVFALYKDQVGNFWIGTPSGLDRLQGEKFIHYTTKDGLSVDKIVSIYEDREGNLWIGTGGGGLNRWNPKDGRFTVYTEKNGLSDNYIFCIYRDREEDLWIGTNGGLNRWNPKSGNVALYTTRNGLSHNIVRRIYRDRADNLWIGTEGGLNRLNLKSKNLTSFTQEDGLSYNSVRALYEDSDGSMWIGTNGGGLNRMKGGQFKSITEKEGLFDDTVHQILEDEKGNFWISCNKGIFMVSKEELNDFCDGKQTRVNCVSYDEKDGMKSRECNGWGQPSGWKDPDGILWFPTMKGLVRIDPGSIKPNPLPPPVMIEKIIVDEREIQLPVLTDKERLPLSPGKDQFEIHYTGLSFQVSKKVRFKYRLEGFDEEWKDVGPRRIAYYTNLPPGNYTFRVIACNSDGLWNETGAAVSFYLKPFFYQTTLFYIICAVLILLNGFLLYKVRVRQLENRNREFREQAEKLRELAETAARANQLKSQFLANMSHEIRTPMNAILGFSEILEEEIHDEQHRKHLKAISVSGKTLLNLINDILDLSRIEAGKLELEFEPTNPRLLLNDIRLIFSTAARERGLDFQLEFDPRLPESLRLDSLRIRQVLFNLVGNAVKFTDSGFVRLSAGLYDKPGDSGTPGPAADTADVIFSVEDSGRGIAPDQQKYIFEAFAQPHEPAAGRSDGAGLGLAITRRLTEMMGGEISVESEENKGTTFRVVLKKVKVSGVLVDIDETPGISLDTLRLGKATILVADDKSMNRKLLARFLVRQNVDIINAENGKAAVDMVRKHRPDLVLMDIKMPVMDGLEATRILKDDKDLKHIPVIFVTAHGFPEHQLAMEKAGGDAVLIKPVSKLELIGQLIRFLPYTEPEPESDDIEKPATTGEETVSHSYDGFNASLFPPDVIRSIPKLTQTLEQEFLPRWERISKTFVLDEIEDFALELSQLGARFRVRALENWSKRLYKEVGSFDMRKITETLAEFPSLVSKTAALSADVRPGDKA